MAEAFAEALHQASGAPARVELGDQATIRLSSDAMFVPPQPATKLLIATGRQVPASGPGMPEIMGLLVGSDGIDMAGFIRFVRAGFVEADAMLTWTPDDLMASLRDSVEQGNPDRIRLNQPPLEARGWVQVPHYDAQTHQLAWAALVLPKSAPRGSDGEVIYHAVAFGREGFIGLSIGASLEKAEQMEHLTAGFLSGLKFRAGKGYGDVGPQDHRAENSLAQAIGLTTLHSAPTHNRFWRLRFMVPAAGVLVVLIGALSMGVYLLRHTRQEVRRG